MDKNVSKLALNDWVHAADSDVQNYLNACKEAISSDQNFSSFRSSNRYGVILEGGLRVIGESALRRLKRVGAIDWLLRNLEAIKENDQHGGPVLHQFEGLPGVISSSSLQYALDVFNIIKLIDTEEKALNIVEVGPGFGGLSRLLIRLKNVKKYTLIDHSEACLLSKVYLSKYPECEGKIEFVDASQVETYATQSHSIDLFIASASIAELSVERQNFYFEKIIPKSTSSYIVYNSLHIPQNFELLDKNINILKSQNKGVYFENPWFKIIFLYIHSRAIVGTSKRHGVHSDLKKYFKGYPYLLIRIFRFLKYKVLRSY